MKDAHEQLQTAPEWVHDVYRNAPALLGYDDIAKTVGLARGSIANWQSEGRAPANGVMIGRRRMFPRLDVCLWLIDRAAQNEGKYPRRAGGFEKPVQRKAD